MSRKGMKPMLGGIVELQCQHGHTLGRVASGPAGMHQPLDGPGWKEHITVVAQKPLSMCCRSCEAEGRKPDLRGKWEKVWALCEQLENDYQIKTLIYTLGG